MAGAPAALAVIPAPPSGDYPVAPPPPPSPAAHLPFSAVAVIVIASMVLSVATTLITLAAQRTIGARRAAGDAELLVGAEALVGAEPEADVGDVVASRHYAARQGRQ